MRASTPAERPLRNRKNLFLVATLLLLAPVMAGRATVDLSGQTRATPDTTPGALEIQSATVSPPQEPTGLVLTMEQVTL